MDYLSLLFCRIRDAPDDAFAVLKPLGGDPLCQCEVRPITTDRYPTKAPRPKYSVLSKAKIKQTFGMAIPTWQDGLKRFFAELKEEQA